MPDLPDSFQLPNLRKPGTFTPERHPRRPGAGRALGRPNKITRDLKVGIIDAAVAYGSDGNGSGGLSGYLLHLAGSHPKAFAGLTAHGRLFLTVVGGFAEFERELIVERTAEGRERALARGVAFGRKPKLNQHQRQEAIARREAGETVQSIARSYDVHHSMIIVRLQP